MLCTQIFSSSSSNFHSNDDFSSFLFPKPFFHPSPCRGGSTLMSIDSQPSLPYQMRSESTSLLKRLKQVCRTINASLAEIWGFYLRVRIMFDVTKPLPHGIPILFPEMASPTWLELKYEDIPDHCYHCGRLGHSYFACTEFANGGALSCSASPQQPSTPGSRSSTSTSSSQLNAPLMISPPHHPIEPQPTTHFVGLPTSLSFAIGSSDGPPVVHLQGKTNQLAHLVSRDNWQQLERVEGNAEET
uniref:CCHC-type domain-containing protein n=1 Tax=Cannabis sativa TaxID=3483 RepID=A0A803PU99_CANSA